MTSFILQVGFITFILFVFACILLKYLTYTTPNPDAKIKLSDKDPNRKAKGYKRQDLTIHELRKYDGRHAETNFVIFVAVNGYIFDVTIDRHLYGPGGHYFALAGRDASRALSKFSITCDSLPTEEDLMPDLTTSEVAQLNEWYGQFSDRYQCVGRLIRSTQERYVYDTSDEELIDDDDDDDINDDIDKYCGIQSEVMTIPSLNTSVDSSCLDDLLSDNIHHDYLNQHNNSHGIFKRLSQPITTHNSSLLQDGENSYINNCIFTVNVGNPSPNEDISSSTIGNGNKIDHNQSSQSQKESKIN